MKKLFSIALCTLFIFCYSCNKNEKSEPQKSLKEIKLNGWKIDNVKFAQNNIGIKHNLFLDDVVELDKFPNLDVQDVVSLLEKKLPDEYLKTHEALSKNNAKKGISLEIESELIRLKNGGVKKHLSKQAQSKNLNISPFDEYCSEIAGVMTDPNIIIPITEGNIDPFLESLNSMYDHIIVDNNLTTIEKEELSVAMEVAFYSNLYWIEVMTDPLNSWNPTIQNSIQGEFEDYFGFPEEQLKGYQTMRSFWGRGWWRTLVVAAADVGGAVFGFTVTSPVLGINIGAAIGCAAVFSGSAHAVL